MNNDVGANGSVTYYVVRVHGRDVTPKVNSLMLAEMEKQKLPADEQAIAEVVPVTAEGKQVLFG